MKLVMILGFTGRNCICLRLLALCLVSLTLVGCFDFSGQSENEVRFNFAGRDPADAIQCIEDSHCGLRHICVRNLCIPGCRSDGDCPSGEGCGGDPPQCVSALECRTDGDCSDRYKICHPALSICVACLRSSDCEEGAVCLVDPACFLGERRCLRTDYACGGCVADWDCAEGFCEVESGRCVACREDSDCSVADVCDPESGSCTECVTGDDCLGTELACLRGPAGGRCVRCVTDDDCEEGTCNRDTLSCQGCSADVDCRQPGLRCNPASGLCWDDMCRSRESADLIELRVELRRSIPFLTGVAVAPVLDASNPSEGRRSVEIVATAAPPDGGVAVATFVLEEESAVWTTSSGLGGGSGVALGDVLGDGRTDVIVVRGGRLTALNASGSPVWTSGTFTSHLPGLFDVDGDGFSEIVAGGSVFSEEGVRVWLGGAHQGGHLGLALPGIGLAADLDGDGSVEVIAGGTVYSTQGEILCSAGADGYAAVADLDADGLPEIVIVSADASIRVSDADCAPRWGPLHPAGEGVGGGPPAVGDFDGDGGLEIAYVATGGALVMLKADGTTVWTAPLVEAHPAAGVAGSDLDGDGVMEILVSDSVGVHVHRGTDGFRLASGPEGASRHALVSPIVADIDGDGSAEIIVAAGNGDAQDEIVVFGDLRDRWAGARDIWNQAAYFVSNIRDDMSVPTEVGPFWLDGNGMRSQPVTVARDPAPNLALRRVPGAVDLGDCPDRYTLGIGVYNRGSADVPSGVTVVTLAPGNPQASVSAQTTRRLGPGDEEVLVLTFHDLMGPVEVEASVSRDPAEEAALPECRTDDNILILEDVGCAAAD